MKIEQIILKDGKIKGTDITPKKVGTTQKIVVPIQIDGFFGGVVKFLPTKFESNIQERLATLQMENKEYLEVNAFSKARRNSKKYSTPIFNVYYKAFIDFHIK